MRKQESTDISLGKACPGIGTNGSERPSRDLVVLVGALDDVYYKGRSMFVSIRECPYRTLNGMETPMVPARSNHTDVDVTDVSFTFLRTRATGRPRPAIPHSHSTT